MSKKEYCALCTHEVDNCTCSIYGKVVSIKTLDITKDFLNTYLVDCEKVILEHNVFKLCIEGNQEAIQSNTFNVNPYLLNTYSIQEIEEITWRLNKVFPPLEELKFKGLLYQTQFCVQVLKQDKYPCKACQTNYSIFQIDDHVIVFHLDLHNGHGVTINSIFKSEQLTKQFDHIFPIHYWVVGPNINKEFLLEDYFSEEEHIEFLYEHITDQEVIESQIEDYQDSEQYEIDSEKAYEAQSDAESLMQDHKATSHPDYPKDFD